MRRLAFVSDINEIQYVTPAWAGPAGEHGAVGAGPVGSTALGAGGCSASRSAAGTTA